MAIWSADKPCGSHPSIHHSAVRAQWTWRPPTPLFFWLKTEIFCCFHQKDYNLYNQRWQNSQAEERHPARSRRTQMKRMNEKSTRRDGRPSPTFYPGSRSTPPADMRRGTRALRPWSPAAWGCDAAGRRLRLPGCRWSLINVSSGCAPSSSSSSCASSPSSSSHHHRLLPTSCPAHEAYYQFAFRSFLGQNMSQ